MGNLFYLLNISVSGIKNIKDEIRLDFYKKTVNRDFNPEKHRVKAIYGENGSGKTAIITAVKIFQDLLLDSHYLNESNTQEFFEEIINKTTNVFRFQCEYLLSLEQYKIIYCYSVEIGKDTDGFYKIKHESLKSKNGNYANKSYETIFESRDGELVSVDCKEGFKAFIEKKTFNLLSTNSFAQLLFLTDINAEEKIDEEFCVHIVVCEVFVMCIKIYLAEEDQHELYFLRKRLEKNALGKEGMLGAVDDVWKSLNSIGVNERNVDKSDFKKYQERVAQLADFIGLFKKDLVSIDIDAKDNGNQYVCDLNLNYGNYVINKEFESTGIKKLIRMYDCLAFASIGGIAFIDEMDSNLNDVYLCKLIEYFMYYAEGQLCFTTHNIDPMTILKENKNSIDFLSNDNHLTPWTTRGNAAPDNCYKNGMIENLPFNIEATDFIGMFGE